MGVNYPSLRKGLRGEFALYEPYPHRRVHAATTRYPYGSRATSTSPYGSPNGYYGVVTPYNFKFKLNYPPASPVSPRFRMGSCKQQEDKVIEVKSAGIDKGRAVLCWISRRE